MCMSPCLLAYINMAATFLTFHVLSVEMGLFANGYICVGGMRGGGAGGGDRP